MLQFDNSAQPTQNTRQCARVMQGCAICSTVHSLVDGHSGTLAHVGLAAVAAIGLCVLLRIASAIWLHVYGTLRINATWARYVGGGNRWAVVTGATDGIGLEMARHLAALGLNTVLLGRNVERLRVAMATVRAAAEAAGKKKVRVEVLQYDLAHICEPGAAARLAETISLGGTRDIAVFVNNAGVSHGHPEFLVEADEADLQAIMTVDVCAPVLLARHVLPGMLARVAPGTSRGLLINVGSFSGSAPVPLLQTYSGAKAFLRTWSAALAAETAPRGVDTVLLNTYFVATKMSKVRRASLLVPSAADYAAAALVAIGRTGGSSPVITPYLPHALVAWAMDVLPASLLLWINTRTMAATRARALRKKAQ